MRKFSKKILNIILGFILFLLFVIIVPLFFIAIWIAVGNINWKKVLDVKNNIETIFPDYVITADIMETKGFGFSSFGSFYIHLENFSFKDKKNKSVFLNIKKAKASLPFRNVIRGKFFPILKIADNVEISINIDQIINDNPDFDTQKLISNIVGYANDTIKDLISGNTEFDINNVQINLIRRNSIFCKISIKDNKITKKTNGFLYKNKIKYEAVFFINNTKGNLVLDCDSFITKTSCNVSLTNFHFDSIFNEANRTYGLQTKNLKINSEGQIILIGNYVSSFQGLIKTKEGFEIYNLFNKLYVNIGATKLNAKITKNLKNIDIQQMMFDTKNGTFVVDKIKSSFINPNELSVFDVGTAFFSSGVLNISDFYNYVNVFLGEKQKNETKNIIEEYLVGNIVSSSTGSFSWGSKRGKNNQLEVFLKDYNINISNRVENATIPILNNIKVSDCSFSLDLSPKVLNLRINDGVFNNFGLGFEDIKISIDRRKTLSFDFLGKNKNVFDIINIVSNIFNIKDATKYINVDKELVFDISINLKIPFSQDYAKQYKKLDLQVEIKNIKTSVDYFGLGFDNLFLRITKNNNSDDTNIECFFDKTKKEKDGDKKYKCSAFIPLNIKPKKKEIFDFVKSDNIFMSCNGIDVLNGSFVYSINNKNIKTKIFDFVGNNIDFFLEKDKKNVQILIDGNDLDLERILLFVLEDKKNISFNFDTEADFDETIKLKIKTDKMKAIRNIINILLGKNLNVKEYFNKDNEKDFDLILKTDIKKVKILNDIILEDVKIDANWGKILNITSSWNFFNKKEKGNVIFNVIQKGSERIVDLFIKDVHNLIDGFKKEKNADFQIKNIFFNGVFDKDVNFIGKIKIGDIIYKTKNSKIVDNINIKETTSDISYCYKENILNITNGNIFGIGLYGEFNAKLDMNTEYFRFLTYFTIGNKKDWKNAFLKQGEFDHNANEKNFSGFKYDLKGYLYNDFDGSLTVLGGFGGVRTYASMFLFMFGAYKEK